MKAFCSIALLLLIAPLTSAESVADMVKALEARTAARKAGLCECAVGEPCTCGANCQCPPLQTVKHGTDDEGATTYAEVYRTALREGKHMVLWVDTERPVGVVKITGAIVASVPKIGDSGIKGVIACRLTNGTFRYVQVVPQTMEGAIESALQSLAPQAAPLVLGQCAGGNCGGGGGFSVPPMMGFGGFGGCGAGGCGMPMMGGFGGGGCAGGCCGR